MRAWVRARVCVYVCVHVCMCVCVYVCLCVSVCLSQGMTWANVVTFRPVPLPYPCEIPAEERARFESDQRKLSQPPASKNPLPPSEKPTVHVHVPLPSSSPPSPTSPSLFERPSPPLPLPPPPPAVSVGVAAGASAAIVKPLPLPCGPRYTALDVFNSIPDETPPVRADRTSPSDLLTVRHQAATAAKNRLRHLRRRQKIVQDEERERNRLLYVAASRAAAAARAAAKAAATAAAPVNSIPLDASVGAFFSSLLCSCFGC